MTHSLRSWRSSLSVRSCAIAFLPWLVAAPSAQADGVCDSADFDSNGVVDGADLASLLGGWGTPNPILDLDANGVVDGADLATLLGSWGRVPATACVSIESVDPTSGPPDTLVTFVGNFPDPDKDNYAFSGFTEAATTGLPMKPIAIGAGTINGTVGPFPTAGPITIVCGLGQGTDVPVVSPPPSTTIGGAWSWLAKGPPLTTNVTFTTVAPAESVETFFSTLTGGALTLTIDHGFNAGTHLRVWTRSHHVSTGPLDPYIGFDSRIDCLTLQAATTATAAATNICAAVSATFASHLPAPIVVSCTSMPSGGGATITLALPGKSTDSGYLTIEVLDPGSLHCACDSDADGSPDCDDNCVNTSNPSQADTDGDGYGDVCSGPCTDTCWPDFNDDGVVDGSDLGLLFANALIPCGGTPFCCADTDGDGVVGMSEITQYINTWFGFICPSGSSDNNECGSAMPIGTGTVGFSTSGATSSVGGQYPSCPGGLSAQPDNDIWFVLTAPLTGTLHVSTCDSADFDTLLAVYRGPCNGLMLLGCNDDALGCGGFTSKVDVAVTAGDIILVRLGGFMRASGSGILDVSY